MPVIDAHQHFWKFNPERDNWIDETMGAIRRDFMPSDLKPLLEANGVDGCIIIQSDQSEAENDFQLKNAEQNDFIKGVVGWVDLQSEQVENDLSRYHHHKKMKGFRHVLQSEPQRDRMLKPDFMRGIRLLQRYNFTYDILVYSDQLKYIPTFVKSFPEQLFVIDHLAKPRIKEKEINRWRKDIKAVAICENVYCKISGMITEADWHQWSDIDLLPYMDTVVEAFGTGRIMFGSDWPVCLLAGSYEKAIGIVKKYFSSFSKNEQDLFFGGNAIQFYRLNHLM